MDINNNLHMALIFCPECGKKISEHVDRCPNCGLERAKFGDIASNNMLLIKQIKDERRKFLKKVCLRFVLPLAIVGAGVAYIFIDMENDKRAYRRERAERCKQEEIRISDLLSQKKEEFYQTTGLRLKGEYSASFINKAMQGRDYLGESGQQILIDNGDGDVLAQMKPSYIDNGDGEGAVTEMPQMKAQRE